MPYCCVPACTSQYGKAQNISFHEIPADPDARKKWLEAISRKDWVPNETCNYTRVCSLHFKQETDYRKGLKRKWLLPTAVPSIFPPDRLCSQPPVKKLKATLENEKCEAEKENRATFTETLQGNLHVPEQVYSVKVLDRECLNEDPDLMKVKDAAIQVDVFAKKSSMKLRLCQKKMNRALQKLQVMQDRLDNCERELKRYKEDCDACSYQKVLEDARSGVVSAVILLDQIRNYDKKRPKWSECSVRRCILWRACSPKGYNHARKNELFKLPSRTTLQRYMGNITAKNEPGVSPLVIERLKAETRQLTAPQEKVCSLILDEMSMQTRYIYDKKNDKFVGDVNLGPVSVNHTSEFTCTENPVQSLTQPTAEDEKESQLLLAKSLLCFVICGLSTKYVIPVAYFFTSCLRGKQLKEIVAFVVGQVEKCGLTIVRIVSDNHKTNVALFRLLGGGKLLPIVAHPNDPARKMFVSFDYCHIIKNIRNQFLKHPFGFFLKQLYELQRKSNSLVKPVRFLSRKHIYPTNFEKMNVRRAVDIFSPHVTAALKFLETQSSPFAGAHTSIEYMEETCKWFTMNDVSNCTQYIHLRNPNCRHFDDPSDDRLQWMEDHYLAYLKTLMTPSKRCMPILTAETYEAVCITSASTAACVRALLREHQFKFVLTRRFSSDPVEALFGCLRQSAGCHDQLDALALQNSIKKVLATGIVAATVDSSVSMSTSNTVKPTLHETSGQAVTEIEETPSSSLNLPTRITGVLNVLHATHNNHHMPTTMLNASLADTGGYIVCVVQEHIDCDECLRLLECPKSQKPLLGIIHNRDRGGLKYPTDALVSVLCTIQRFTELVLPYICHKTNVLQIIVDMVKPHMLQCPALTCKKSQDLSHKEELCTLVCTKFLRAILVNHATNVTENAEKCKKLKKKPLSRKVHRL